MRPAQQSSPYCGVSSLPVGVRFRQGFTLLELAVIMAIVAVLVGLLVPTLTKARALAHRAGCLSNLRQLSVSWVLYNGDNNGQLVESYPGNSPRNPNPLAWVQGNMQLPDEAGNAALITRGLLFQYNDSTAIYRCPADRTASGGGAKATTKTGSNVRSYSMNAFMGDRSSLAAPANHAFPPASDYVPFYSKESELRHPSTLWVLIDEDNRTIGDGCFVFDPSGKQSHPDRYPAASKQRHNFGFGLTFADGHAEIWRFSDPNIVALSAAGVKSEKPEGTAASRDFQKLGQATATLKP